MKIKYHSTRGGDKGVDFKTMLLSGYATDGGMLIPEIIPSVSKEDLKTWAGLSFEDLAFQIISLFIDEEEIPQNDLKDIVHKGFSVFSTPGVIPVKNLADGLIISELFHGPSLAFKDLSMSCMGHFYDYFMKKDESHLILIVYTSGDTGSAAIEAVKNSSNVDIVVLLPRGYCTEIQELQMTTVVKPNVHVFRVDGPSDEAEITIRKLFADTQFVAEHSMASASSLNFTRIMLQIIHYFYTYLKICPDVDETVEMIVPTGGCGNVAAGFFAREMGLPVSFAVAVNENNVLSRMMESGETAIGDVIKTLSPAMDIQYAYNLERIWYLNSNGDTESIKKIMEQVDSNRVVVPSNIMEKMRSSLKVYTIKDDEAVTDTMKRCWAENQYIVCPHTAVGVDYYYSTLKDTTGKEKRPPSVVLATASPVKFPEAAKLAGIPYQTSQEIENLKTAETRYIDLERDQDWLAEKIEMKIKYHSTRGGVKGVDFKTMLLSGYATDGGLLLPETIPSVSKETIRSWADLSFEELAFQIISLFIDEEEIPQNDLKDILHKAYSVFLVPGVVPVTKLADGLIISELFHGPSLAFKDLSMSCMGHFLDYFMKKENRRLTLIVCTSGDTGSSAIEAVKNLSNVDIVILLPKGFCTEIQELQMTTVVKPNVHVFRFDGAIDDADVSVREIFADSHYVAEHSLGSASSINFTRILFQLVHFFYTYLKVCPDVDETVEMILPTGACGNFTAGFVAKQMGLPASFVCAVNRNNALSRMMESGETVLGDVEKTLAPAMDNQFAYNLERVWYFNSNCDTESIKKIMVHVDSKRVVIPSNIMNNMRSSLKVHTVKDDEAIKDTMKRCWEENQYNICPHTAVGVDYYYSTLKDTKGNRPPSVVFATASPLKFPEAASLAGIPFPTSELIENLKSAETRYIDLERDQDWVVEVKKVIEKITSQRKSMASN